MFTFKCFKNERFDYSLASDTHEIAQGSDLLTIHVL